MVGAPMVRLGIESDSCRLDLLLGFLAGALDRLRRTTHESDNLLLCLGDQLLSLFGSNRARVGLACAFQFGGDAVPFGSGLDSFEAGYFQI